MEEERDNDRKAGSWDYGDTPGGQAGQPQDLNLSSAYTTLLEQYREALARLHILEMQNQNLANMIKLSPPPVLPQDLRASTGALESAELAARIDAVERLLAKTAADGSEEGGSERQGVPSKSGEEVAQLRIQIQSLLGQLSRVNGGHTGTRRGGSGNGGGHGWRRWSYKRKGWLNRILKR